MLIYSDRMDSTPYRAHGGPLVNLLLPEGPERSKLWEEALSYPRLTLTERQLCDLEMLITGAFSPLTGFMTEEEYTSVRDTMRLPSGTLWPMPIVLDVAENHPYSIGTKLLLVDIYGNPLAVLDTSSIYTPNKEEEAQKVFGTTDELHFGVKYLNKKTKPVYLGGKVTGLALSQKHDFKELRATPQELRNWFKENGWEKIIAFQTRNPMHRAHFEIVRRALQEHDANLLIHPAVGLTKDGDIDYTTRVKIYKIISENYLPKNSKVSLLPIAMRMGGPREALWHAIIRKNHGATHFIVGRDHAGPGKNKEGKDFYRPYDAQNLAKQYAEELGLTIVDPKEMVYVEEHKTYFPSHEIPEGGTVKNISGTQFRAMLRSKTPIPSWFSFPEVVAELQKTIEREEQRGTVIFLTGLSGAGKSTIASLLEARLKEHHNRTVSLLDGDVVRDNLSKGLGFSKEDRDANIQRIGFVAAEIARHGGIAICAAIAPYREAREKNRELISSVGNYVEVHVDAPLEVCEARDTKGLYKKARSGALKQFTGISDPYEAPESPEVKVTTAEKTAEECVMEIIAHLLERNHLSP